ncbi:UNVERIFIED_CONTAM: hypothetical protein FKN15_016178 [Acipenser sinensis]
MEALIKTGRYHAPGDLSRVCEEISEAFIEKALVEETGDCEEESVLCFYTGVLARSLSVDTAALWKGELVANNMISIYDYDREFGKLTMSYFFLDKARGLKTLGLMLDFMTFFSQYPFVPDFAADTDICFMCLFDTPHGLSTLKQRLLEMHCTHYSFVHDLCLETNAQAPLLVPSRDPENGFGVPPRVSDRDAVDLKPDGLVNKWVSTAADLTEAVKVREIEDVSGSGPPEDIFNKLPFDQVLEIIKANNVINHLETKRSALTQTLKRYRDKHNNKTAVRYLHLEPYQTLLSMLKRWRFKTKLSEVFETRAVAVTEVLRLNFDTGTPYPEGEADLVSRQRLQNVRTFLATTSLNQAQTNIVNEFYKNTFFPVFRYRNKHTVVSPRYTFFKALEAFQVPNYKIVRFINRLKTLDLKWIASRPYSKDILAYVLQKATEEDGGGGEAEQLLAEYVKVFWLTVNLYAFLSQYKDNKRSSVRWYWGDDIARLAPLLRDPGGYEEANGFSLLGFGRVGLKFFLNKVCQNVYFVAPISEVFNLFGIYSELHRRYGC